MNTPRLLLAIAGGFVVIFGTDLLIHHFWLAADYKAMQSVWRPESQMNALMHWMFIGQILAAGSFVVIWAKGFGGRSVGTALVFALLIGIFQQTWVIASYVIFPIPADLALKWYFSGLVQVVLLGIVVALIYRPRVTGP